MVETEAASEPCYSIKEPLGIPLVFHANLSCLGKVEHALNGQYGLFCEIGINVDLVVATLQHIGEIL